MGKRIPLVILVKHEQSSRHHTGEDISMVEINAMAKVLTVLMLFVSFYSALFHFLNLILSFFHFLIL